MLTSYLTLVVLFNLCLIVGQRPSTNFLTSVKPGPWRRSGSRNESPMRRDDRGDRRDDRGRRDEFRRDDMGRGGDRGDEPAPQRKRLQLQPRTKPADAPQRRSEPVGGGET